MWGYYHYTIYSYLLLATVTNVNTNVNTNDNTNDNINDNTNVNTDAPFQEISRVGLEADLSLSLLLPAHNTFPGVSGGVSLQKQRERPQPVRGFLFTPFF